MNAIQSLLVIGLIALPSANAALICSELFDRICVGEFVLKGSPVARGKVLAIYEDGKALFDEDDLPGARITPTMVRQKELYRQIPELEGIRTGDIATYDADVWVITAIYSNRLVELSARGQRIYLDVRDVQLIKN